MSQIKNFFTQLLSIDESRKSIVVIILICVTVFSLYKATTMGGVGDIPPNCMTIILALSGLVFGTNAITGIAGIVQASKGNGNSNYGSYNSGYNSNYSNTSPIVTPVTNVNQTNTGENGNV